MSLTGQKFVNYWRLPSEKTKIILAHATSLLEAQIVLLREDGVEGLLGRLASAGRTAANALLYLGRNGSAAEVEQAMATAQAQRQCRTLDCWQSSGLWNGETKVGSHPTNIPRVQVVAPRALRVDMDRIDALVKLTGELTCRQRTPSVTLAKRIRDNEDPAAVASILRDQHALFDRLAIELQGRGSSYPSPAAAHGLSPVSEVGAGDCRQCRQDRQTDHRRRRYGSRRHHRRCAFRAVASCAAECCGPRHRELGASRVARGKPAMGTLVLRGHRDAENVHIEVEDDGGGIDVDRVRAVAGARGVASEEALAAMTDGEAIDLIFAAGFSTAAAVTDLSGRGVGMDSVRTAVERLGGTVTLQSGPGIGTMVSLILPFSLMMTRVMTVEVVGQAFGLPLDSVVETTIVDRDMIVPIGSGRAFLLRDRTIPLVDLADTLGISRDVIGEGPAKVVIVSAAGQIGGIEVDRLGERLDVMLKPMEGFWAA